MCNDNTIKELLPAYIERGLDQADVLRVRKHLDSCDDCRTELSLLSLMVEETVPDPGDAFWAAMPDHVYRAVQKHRSKKKTFDLAQIFDWIALTRWTWAAATVGTVLIISWFLVTPPQKGTEMPLSQGYEFTDDTVATGSISVAELDNAELSTIDSWAGSELASIAREAEQVLGTGRETDIYEELEDLNAKEVDRLSIMLAQI